MRIGVAAERSPTRSRLNHGFQAGPLKVSDFHQDGGKAPLRFHLKGGHVKTKGIRFAAAGAIAEYIRGATIESGPRFRPRAIHSEALSDRLMTERTMNRMLMTCLERLPSALQEIELPDGSKTRRCVYSPHSLHCGQLLLDAAVREGSGSARPAHRHHADLRQAPPRGEELRLPQDADLNGGLCDLNHEMAALNHNVASDPSSRHDD